MALTDTNALQAPANLLPNTISQLCGQICSIPAATTCIPMQRLQQSTYLYGKGLTAAASVQKEPVKATALKVRQAAVGEVADWVHSMHDATGRSIQTAIPEDILVYPTQHCLPNHDRSSASTRELVVAPGSLSAIQSHLATKLELLGRTGDSMHTNAEHAAGVWQPCSRAWLP